MNWLSCMIMPVGFAFMVNGQPLIRFENAWPCAMVQGSTDMVHWIDMMRVANYWTMKPLTIEFQPELGYDITFYRVTPKGCLE